MNTPPRRVMLLAALVLATAVAAGWSYRALSSARTVSRTAEADLAEVDRLSRQIAAWRHAPRQANAGALEAEAISQRVEAVTDAVGMPRDRLERIWPQPPQRLGESVYIRHAFHLVVREVSLLEAVSLLHGLTGITDSMNIDTLRLSAPRGGSSAYPGQATVPTASDGSEVWSLETTVSYLVYTPQRPATSEDARPLVAEFSRDLP